MTELSQRKRTLVDPLDTIDEYIRQTDWRTRDNSNKEFSLSGMVMTTQGKLTANYFLDRVYSEEAGEAHRNGAIHIHDLDVLGGYCAGWSLRQLLETGFRGAPGRVESTPPRHMRSAVGQIVNFLCSLQGEWAGAQAFSSFDTLMAPFVRLDNLSYEEVEQNMQEMVFSLNVPSRTGGQSPFTNLTFDWTVPEDMKYLNPIIGGEECDFTYGDLTEEMAIVNRAFIAVMMQGDDSGRPFSFPIPTYNITKDFEWDSENANLLFEMTAKYGLPYFQNFINSDMDPEDVRSMCPLTQDTRVLVRSNQSGVRVAPISDIVATMKGKGTRYEVWSPEGWAAANPVQVEMTDVYEITLSNGTTVRMGKNHIQPTKERGTIKAENLIVGDWLPFNKLPVVSSDVGTYDLGYIVGAYFGDGSRSDRSIVYSLNKDTDIDTISKLVSIWNALGFKTRTRDDNQVTFLFVKGPAYDFISKYIIGTDALTKSFSSAVFDTSVDFRYGLIAGYRATDGSKLKKRLYTSSQTMAQSLIELFGSLGEKARIGFVDKRDNRLGTNDSYRIDYTSRTRYGRYFDEDHSFNYYQIVDIKNIGKLPQQYLYCFEVDTEEHLFSLASGLVTHNCRLRLDLRELRTRGNGLFGSGEKTGSVGVVTINMARLGYKHRWDIGALYQELDQLLSLAKDSLEAKRVFVNQLMEDGLYPYSKFYLGHLNSHFSTIGVNGMNEMIRNFTNDVENITTEFGHDMARGILVYIRDRMSDFQEETGNLYNLEATPGEGACHRFALRDIERFPDIIQAGTPDNNYYTNSSQAPVNYTEDLFEVLENQDDLQTLYTGGTVLHVYQNSVFSTPEIAKAMVKKIFETHHLPYITLAPVYSICPNHGFISGTHEECPECGTITEVYARVMGYYRPVRSWNVGKQGEFSERVYFKEVQNA